MDLESIYLELTKEGQDYYCSLDDEQKKNILSIVSDTYEFKLNKLIEQENEIQDEYKEKIKSISYHENEKLQLDQWINNNQSLKNTSEYKEKMEQLKKFHFELIKNSKANIKDAYNESIKLLDKEKEEIENHKLLHLEYLLEENLKSIKDVAKDKKLQKIYSKQKKQQEKEEKILELEELEQERLELEELEQERLENLSKIKEDATKRGIENLLHFTTLNYLDQLLNEGIFSRDKLRKDKINSRNYIYTDSNNFSGSIEWVSTSISFPNSKMFFSKRMNSYNLKQLKDVTGWVVIALDSKILWELDCRFFPLNAAKYRHIAADFYKKYEKFDLMFEKSTLRSPTLPDKFTTDVQAEVLVKDFIATKYIKEIIFEDTKTANNFQNITNTNYKITVDRSYFNRREDNA